MKTLLCWATLLANALIVLHSAYSILIYRTVLGRNLNITFTFMHLADTFIQSDLQCIQAIHFLSVCVFPGNRTHNLCTANAML